MPILKVPCYASCLCSYPGDKPLGSQWYDYCPIRDTYTIDKSIKLYDSASACDITPGMSGAWACGLQPEHICCTAPALRGRPSNHRRALLSRSV
jgi:hypothetical protein